MENVGMFCDQGDQIAQFSKLPNGLFFAIQKSLGHMVIFHVSYWYIVP
jgi:hypothetical protein